MLDATVKDGKLIVGASYLGQETINEYLKDKRLKQEYTEEELRELIDAIAFYLDSEDDYKLIQSMLEKE